LKSVFTLSTTHDVLMKKEYYPVKVSMIVYKITYKHNYNVRGRRWL